MTLPASQRIERLHYSRSQKMLELSFADGEAYRLSAEFLRVYSPSAEVRGHGPGQEVLQTGKASVAITGIDRVGHYAVQIAFDDGHDSGIYSWSYLRDLAEQQDRYWQNYLQQLSAAGKSRDAELQVLHFQP